MMPGRRGADGTSMEPMVAGKKGDGGDEWKNRNTETQRVKSTELDTGCLYTIPSGCDSGWRSGGPDVHTLCTIPDVKSAPACT
jgi:hypothetical protein